MIGTLAFNQRDRPRERRAVAGAQLAREGRDIRGGSSRHCANQAGNATAIKARARPPCVAGRSAPDWGRTGTKFAARALRAESMGVMHLWPGFSKAFEGLR